MSLKEWKNKELSQNLTEKWGFKMDLSKLNENKVLSEDASNMDVIRVNTKLDTPVRVGIGSYILITDTTAEMSSFRVIGKREGEILFCRAGDDIKAWMSRGAGGENYKENPAVLMAAGESILNNEEYANMMRPKCPELAQQSPFQEGKEDGNKSTDKYDDNPALKGGQKNLPDALQQGIISSKGGKKKADDDNEKKVDEMNAMSHSAVGGHANQGKRRRK